MLYEITQDCRIANKDYEKGQIVTKEEVGGVFFSVMQEAKQDTIPDEKAEKTAKKSKKKAEESDSDEGTASKQRNITSEEDQEEDQNS